MISFCAGFGPVEPALGQAAVQGYPDSVTAYDAREVARIPRYCIHTQLFRDNVPGGNDPQQIDYWRSVMGETFQAMHHYCWGLMKTNRAMYLARDEKTRKFYLGDAIGEFDYVIRQAKPSFVLLPEILTKKGQNLVRLGRGPQGVLEFERAIELKPDYWPPYAYASDHYRETGEIGKARELIERALAISPDIKALKTRQDELAKLKDGTGKSVK